MVPQHAARAVLPVRWQKLWQSSIVEEPGGGIAYEWNAGEEESADAAASQVAMEDEIEEA
jgi:hypothetical protein